MSLNNKVEKILKIKNTLERKMMNEGLTKSEKTILDKARIRLTEAPIDYTGAGGARMSPGLQSKIEGGQTDFNELGISTETMEFLASKSFVDSVKKLQRILGDNSRIAEGDPRSAFMALMNNAMSLGSRISSLQQGSLTQIEQLAGNLIQQYFNLPEESIRLIPHLTSFGPQRSLSGMRTEPKKFSEEEVKKAFYDADRHKEELEKFAEDFKDLGVEFDYSKGDEIVKKKIEQEALKTFEDEKAKRRFINSINKGFAFNLGDLYEELNEYVDKINPQLSQLYAASQAIMEHLYWLYPDLQQMAAGGGGQLAQHQITKPDGSTENSNDEEGSNEEGSDEEGSDENDFKMGSVGDSEDEGGEETQEGTYTIEAFAPTLPLLIHELLLGVAKYFSWLGGIEGKEKSELIIQSTDTLGNEVWNSYMGKVFFKELMLRFKALNDEYALQDKKIQNRILLFLQLHLATLSKDDLQTLLNGIHKHDERVEELINTLVEGAMEQYHEIHKNIPEPTKNYGSGVDLGDDEEEDDDFDFGDDDDDDDIY
jgi:hypothetical protein